MKFWIPVVSKWQNQYKTLADVPEGVSCVVSLSGEYNLRVRKGNYAYTLDHNGTLHKQNNAETYLFVRTLDPLPKQSVRITDLPDGRCFKLDKFPDIVYWKSRDYFFNQYADGAIGISLLSYQDFADNILDIEMQFRELPNEN